MSDPYPDWDKPATKGDLIKLGLYVSRCLTQTLTLQLVTPDSKVTREMVLQKLARELGSLSGLLDELGGSAEATMLKESAQDE